MSTNDQFGHFFRQRRKSLNLSLSEFCRRNGFDKANISRLERGLTPPPESQEILNAYANALKLMQDTTEMKKFMELAALSHGKLPSVMSEERLAGIEQLIQGWNRLLHEPWVKSRDLEIWSSTRQAQEQLPALIHRLIYAITNDPIRIEFPSGDGVQRHGWDGIVESQKHYLFVPEGVSGWEISVSADPESKANRDFKSRNSGILGLPASETTFVFVTSRKWDGKQKWRDEKRDLGKWKNVEVYDSSDLESWLELTPGVDAWIAEKLGRCPSGVISIDDYWESLSQLGEKRLQPNLFLVSRNKNCTALRAFLLGPPGVMPIECRSPIEGVDFVAAFHAQTKVESPEMFLNPEEQFRCRSKTVIVRDRPQWDALSQSSGSLNLVPLPFLAISAEDLNRAVGRGHHVIVTANQFTNHKIQPVLLQRPTRYDLESALYESGYDRHQASDIARIAGGSLSVLKRTISVIPDQSFPKWMREDIGHEFIAILLAGSWDDSNPFDREILSRLSGVPYGELQNAANRLTMVEDAPVTRIESRWRLVSPEDSWLLAGKNVPEHKWKEFEEIAITVLSVRDDSIQSSKRKRKNWKPNSSSASRLLRRGIAESLAILGVEFSGALAGNYLADQIIHEVLDGAPWTTWVELGDVLPLLAEGAPDTFLTAIEDDLDRNKPELQMVFNHDEDRNFSGCKHAGLLWALEKLAWSPELLFRVSTILARLDHFARGNRWINSPARSLCEILLPWYPQTAAGIEKRVSVMKTITNHYPEVAWKLLLSMMPRSHDTSTPTPRPVWRRWADGWREGTTGPDYWRQVNDAAELFIEIVERYPEKWKELLEKFTHIPDSYRKQLLMKLQELSPERIDLNERLKLMTALRKTIRLHQDHVRSEWALTESSVELLKSILEKIQPDDLVERHAWLFARWVEIEGYADDREKMREEVQRRREDALREIISNYDIEGIKRLAVISEAPDIVGSILATVEFQLEGDILPTLLSSSDTNLRALAKGYAYCCIEKSGWDWIESLPLRDWNPKCIALLISQAPFEFRSWQYVEKFGEKVSNDYWCNVGIFGGRNLSQQELEFASNRFIKVRRYEDVISFISRVCFNDDIASTPPTFVMDLLESCLEWRQKHETKYSDDTHHNIQDLFQWLQKQIPYQDDEPTHRLAQLEWHYLSLLDGYGAEPKTLIRMISDEPKIFTQVITLAFKPESEQEIQAELSNEQRQLAIQAHRLLHHWNHLPGTLSDGSIDEKRLFNWLESARSLCRQADRLKIADYQIGQMFGSTPKPESTEEGVWPCEEICDAIEEANSIDLDEGFRIGIFNSRGVTMRSFLSGGELERSEALKYRKWAEHCELEWPRTADSLRKVAESYEIEAKREDTWADERAIER